MQLFIKKVYHCWWWGFLHRGGAFKNNLWGWGHFREGEGLFEGWGD